MHVWNQSTFTTIQRRTGRANKVFLWGAGLLFLLIGGLQVAHYFVQLCMSGGELTPFFRIGYYQMGSRIMSYLHTGNT